MNQMYTKRKSIQITLFLLLFFHGISNATTYTMKCVPFFSVNWSDPNSWVPAGVPGPGDDVIIDCPDAFVVTDGDITIKTLTVDRLSYITGQGSMTITERMDTKYPFWWQITLIIGPNATGLMTDELADQFSNEIVFYNDLVVNGSLTMESNNFSGRNVTINGTLTQKEGGINATALINPTGIFNIDSPVNMVDIRTMVNKGTINWKKGKIRATWGSFLNEGNVNVDFANAIFEYGGFFPDFTFDNSGAINLSGSVNSLLITKEVTNNGTINIAGPSKLHLAGIDNLGSIEGPAGSSLVLGIENFSTESFFRGGSVIEVPSFETGPNVILDIQQGCDISQIQNFRLASGPITLDGVLPPAANYVISANIQTNTDQNFTGAFTLDWGSFTGDIDIFFDMPNLVLNGGYFGGNSSVTISPATVVNVIQIGFNQLENNGVMNFGDQGYMGGSIGGIRNNGTINTSGQLFTLLGFNNNEYSGLVENNGIININSTTASIYAKFINTGTVNVGSNDSLAIAGELQQQGVLSGQSGSKVALSYTGTSHTFFDSAVTQNLEVLEAFYGNVTFRNGTILQNLGSVISTSSTLQTNIVLPPDFTYKFTDSKIRLNTIFEPSGPFEIVDTDIEGSGNLRINETFNWFGGTLDVPARINGEASVFVRENVKRPVISSPFTNNGQITLSGGIIEINTGFFKNAGKWNVDSDQDVIMDGFTSFTNEGIFSICAEQPIKIIFNVPFINTVSGTFKGDGSYTFNAGFINEGTVAPGCSPGRLYIEDDVESLKKIEIEVEGQENGQFDELIINGDMVAGDLLKIIVPTATIVNGSLKIIHTTGTFTGEFTRVEMPVNYTLQYLPDGVMITSNGTVNVDDETAAEYGIKVTPTLVQSDFVVQTEKSLPVGSDIQLYNMFGELVFTTATTSSGPQKIDVNHLANGMYIVKIQNLPSWNTKIMIVH